MKKLIVLIAGMCFCLQSTNVQAQFTKHFWLNHDGVNYTLSSPTTDGHWVLAAAKRELLPNGTLAARKNTIAVLKVNNPDYAIVDPVTNAPTEKVAVIGMQQGAGEVFNPNVDFEVHCVVQSRYPDTAYILCGSISEAEGDQPVGMVAVLDSKFELRSLRRYNDVKVFYSVYAQDDYYFVCGQMQNNATYRGTGIVLRDNISLPPSPAMSITAFHTLNYPNWAFHKIAVRNRPCEGGIYREFSVSGAETTDKNQQIGWAVFHMNPPFFTFSNAAYAFTPHPQINSRVTIANYPMHSLVPNSQGLLLSASSGNDIFTYVIDDNQMPVMNNAFGMPWHGILTDMDFGGYDQVAWVGNRGTVTAPQGADYMRTNIPYPAPAPPVPLPPPAQLIHFTPFNPMPNAYYSLHKVHYGNDGEFHAGGYYNGWDDDGRRNRTTFAVTPEQVWDDNQCTHREMIDFYELDLQTLTPFSVSKVYIRGEEIKEIITKKINTYESDK